MTDLTRFKNQFKDKRLLVLGFAREGIDTLKFLHKLFPDKIIGVADRLEIRSLEIEARETIKKEKNIRKHFMEQRKLKPIHLQGKNWIDMMKMWR